MTDTHGTPADILLAAFDVGRQIAPLSDTDPTLNMDTAYGIAAQIAARRQARGEAFAGRKIGFTNRTIWPIYNISAPVWGWMYGNSVADLPADGHVPLPALPEPRIEPEIAFGFARSPAPGMSVAQIAGCLDWVAHGFEIVVSLFPGWQLTAPDAVAAMGMHGAFWLGPRIPARNLLAQGPEVLEQFSLTLTGPDETRQGHAGDVLDGPLHALQYLLGEIARMPGAGPVQPGEVITTGTLTDARPIARGQTWQTRLYGIDLPGLTITFR